jgi:hypothetical protein
MRILSASALSFASQIQDIFGETPTSRQHPGLIFMNHSDAVRAGPLAQRLTH